MTDDYVMGHEPHPSAGILAPDSGALRAELESMQEWASKYGIQRDFDCLVFVRIAGCGTYQIKTLDDIPLFSVPCTCGKGYFIKYTRDDDMLLEWPKPPVHGRELVPS